MFLMYYTSIRGEELQYYSKNATWNILYAYIDAHSQRLFYEHPGDGVQSISILVSQCENMTFSDQIRCNIIFNKLVNKVEESSINFI